MIMYYGSNRGIANNTFDQKLKQFLAHQLKARKFY